MIKEKRRFSMYLGVPTATTASILSTTFVTKIDAGDVKKLQPRRSENSDFEAYYYVSREKTPKWMTVLSEMFDVPKFARRSPACVVVFNSGGRTFAVTFGYGAKLLNEDQLEGDFGIKVAINAVADNSLKAVQKSNVASAIQQFAQAAFRSRFGSFGGQSKFEILKRVAGPVSEDNDLTAVVGASGLSFTTTLKLSDIKAAASKILQYYSSNAYKNTAFSVIDEFKPVSSAIEINRLNALLVANLHASNSTFELCVPQLNIDDSGYVKLSGIGLHEEFPDISLELYKSSFDDISTLALDDLYDDKVCLFNDEHENIGNWSVHRCLIGGLEDVDRTRYVLNEGRWYIPSDSIVGPVEKFFRDHMVDPDAKLDTFKICQWKKDVGSKGKSKLVPVYEPEEEYNERICTVNNYILFDQKWHKAKDGTFAKLEMCDIYDPDNLRMIHVKRSSRQPNMLSYLFEQGHRAAELWQRDDVRAQFIERVRECSGSERAERLAKAAPKDITIEFAIADHANNQGRFTIPFLGKLSFESKASDVELRGFRSQVRFIPLGKPKAK